MSIVVSVGDNTANLLQKAITATLSTTNVAAVAFWCKAMDASTTGQGPAFIQTAQGLFGLDLEGGSLVLRGSASRFASADVGGFGPFDDGNWHHFFAGYNKYGYMNWYFDGINKGSCTGSLASNVQKIIVSGNLTAQRTAEVAWWLNLDGTDPQQAAMAQSLTAGADPRTVQTAALQDYFPLRSTLANAAPGKSDSLTALGSPTYAFNADHPSVSTGGSGSRRAPLILFS